MPQIFSIMDVGGRTLLTKARGDIQVRGLPPKCIQPDPAQPKP
jgi:hypothetical protein